MTRYLTAALFLAACAVQPTTSSTSDEMRCQTCDTGVTYQQAVSGSRDWAHGNYVGSTVQHIDCGGFSEPDTGRSGYSCATGFSWFGANYIAGCLFYDDGEIDCGIEEGG